MNQLVVQPTLRRSRPAGSSRSGIAPRALAGPRRQRAAARAGRAPAGVARGGSCSRRTEASHRRPWRYRDFGSLVSLGAYTTVGNLMAKLDGGNLWLEGLFARMMYLSLYKMHEVALHGFWKTALRTAARFIFRRTVARVKLH